MAWNFDCCGAPLAQVLQAPQGLNPALVTHVMIKHYN